LLCGKCLKKNFAKILSYMAKGIKHLALSVAVWKMRLATRYLGFIARPFVSWYANSKVIACGLKARNGDMHIIYSPSENKEHFHVLKYENSAWISVHSFPMKDFSEHLIRELAIPDASIGEIYKMGARNKTSGRMYYSPTITIKNKTSLLRDSITLDNKGDGGVTFSWPKEDTFKPLIYFLIVEDRGAPLAAIYTNEQFFTYPQLKTASMSLGIFDPPPLKKGNIYTTKLAVVDFDGWVSSILTRTFTY